MAQVQEILEKIKLERERQFDLPGSEWDRTNSPGEWISIASHYLSEEVRRNGNIPLKEDFEQSLIKAAAVIVAALEHLTIMQHREQLS